MDFDIAVVIPVLNESRTIEKALTSLSTEADKKTLFVIVDNGSSDDTVDKIRKWKKKFKEKSLVILFEKKRGAICAKRKGLEYAARYSKAIISTDADNWPLKNFYRNLKKDFVSNPVADILRGRVRYNPIVRLQRQVFLPDLMRLIAWQENIELKLFGPFFLGGYFGVKSKRFNKLAFPVNKVPIPSESSIFWSRHCHYLGYKFVLSKPNMRTSNRRFWSDPYGSIIGERSKLIREELKSKKEKEKMMLLLRKNQERLMQHRQEYFARRLLMFILDAIFFEKKVSNKSIVSSSVDNSCQYLGLNTKVIRQFSNSNFGKVKEKILANYKEKVLGVITKNYAEFKVRTS